MEAQKAVMFGNIENADQVRDAMAWFFQSTYNNHVMASVVQHLHIVLIGKSFRRENAIDIILSIPEEIFDEYQTSFVKEDGNKADYLEAQLLTVAR
jgi:hypothetical protein